jgi:hypothetical protein
LHARDGESFIDGARRRAGRHGEVVAGVVNGDDSKRARRPGKAFRVDAGVPADNRPILGCKEETSRSRRRLISTPEITNPGNPGLLGSLKGLKTVPVGAPLLPKRSTGVGMLTTHGFLVTCAGLFPAPPNGLIY